MVGLRFFACLFFSVLNMSNLVFLTLVKFPEVPGGFCLCWSSSGLLHLLPCVCFCLHRILTAVLILAWLWLSFPSPRWQVCRTPACKPSSQLDWEWLKGVGGPSPFSSASGWIDGLVQCSVVSTEDPLSPPSLSDAGCCNSRGQSSAQILNFQMSCSMAEQVTCMPCCT